MPIDSSVVGRPVGVYSLTVAARHCLAYAAGCDDPNPRYLDDARPDGIVAPPLFGVSLDWQLRPGLTEALNLTGAESMRGVHSTQQMIFRRLIRPGDRLSVQGAVVQVEQRDPGAYVVVRYDTTDASGAVVLTVFYGMIFRDVRVTGPARAIDAPPPLPTMDGAGSPVWLAAVDVPRTEPHVYSECANIYNPIHTERAVALAAGLPDIIIHGTLTLAYAVRELTNRALSSDPAGLRQVACRFSGVVIPGTQITIRLLAQQRTETGSALFFDVIGEDGTRVLRNGVALVHGAASLATVNAP